MTIWELPSCNLWYWIQSTNKRFAVSIENWGAIHWQGLVKHWDLIILSKFKLPPQQDHNIIISAEISSVNYNNEKLQQEKRKLTQNPSVNNSWSSQDLYFNILKDPQRPDKNLHRILDGSWKDLQTFFTSVYIINYFKIFEEMIRILLRCCLTLIKMGSRIISSQKEERKNDLTYPRISPH